MTNLVGIPSRAHPHIIPLILPKHPWHPHILPSHLLLLRLGFRLADPTSSRPSRCSFPLLPEERSFEVELFVLLFAIILKFEETGRDVVFHHPGRGGRGLRATFIVVAYHPDYKNLATMVWGVAIRSDDSILCVQCCKSIILLPP